MSWFNFILLLYGLSWAFVGIFRWYAIEKGMIDQPNARSSHIAPTPRGGGVVFFIGWLILLATLYYFHIVSQDYLWVFVPVVMMGLLGFWDDHKRLSSAFRFLIQCIAASLALVIMGEGGELIQNWLPFTIPLPVCFVALTLAIVWVINLFNFMDGSDGIAATQAIFVFSAAGYMLFRLNAYTLGVLAWGLVAILAGFLTWNWPTARIFMGDSGSYFLGSLMAIYALVSYKLFQMPILLWVILTSLFWFDATITLLRRMMAGEDWREPHRSHAYQRLIQSGWSHQKVLLWAIVVNGILAGLALMAYFDPRLSYFALTSAIMLLSCLYIMVEIIRPMFRKWNEAKSDS